ncbi:hypothetical protein FLT15_02685 [Paenibacillus thiaminolyticus]|nr:hypothetical protein [Paenibacillus thiaminolyticus]NGP57323.1 hypothetical protein [Paenibacillus thiaminolyticus]
MGWLSAHSTAIRLSDSESNGSQLTDDVDPELFQKEPKDIHVLLRL